MPYSTGMRLANDRAQIVLGTPAANYTGAATDSDWISLKNTGHVTIIIACGAWAAGTAAITLLQASDVAGTGSKALAFTKQWTNVAAATVDALVETAVVSSTFNLSVANALHVLEIDAASLDLTNGFDCVSVHGATPGSNADIYGVLFILGSPLRYSGVTPPSAITD